MKNLRFLWCLLILISCESVVEVDVPREVTKPTVNAFFTPDSLWSVELSENRYILDNDQFEGLPGATVEVWQNEQLVTELLYQGEDRFKGHSIYQATGASPQTEIPYTLRVQHPDHAPLEAISQVPTAPNVVRATLDTLDVRLDEDFADDGIAYGLTLLLNDPPEENFYSLSVILRSEVFVPLVKDDVSLLSIEENVWFIDVQSDDPIVDNPFNRYRDELLFKDVSFNGQQYELKIYGILELGDARIIRFFSGGSPINEDAYDREGNLVRQAGEIAGIGTLQVVLRNTTEAYYEYNFTRDLQASIEDNPFAQPVQVFDNIENGLGIFAGYNQTEKQVVIR